MGASQNWTLAMQYRSHRSAFSADMVQKKKVQCGKLVLLTWRVVFEHVRVWEGTKISTLRTDLTGDPRPEERVSCHYYNELGELIPFRLTYKSARIVLALSEIFHRRWGAKKVADIYATTPSPVNPSAKVILEGTYKTT